MDLHDCSLPDYLFNIYTPTPRQYDNIILGF